MKSTAYSTFEMLAGYGAAQAVPGPRCSPLRPILALLSALGRTPSPAPALGLLGIFLPGLLTPPSGSHHRDSSP
jgi:hypothetical protein